MNFNTISSNVNLQTVSYYSCLIFKYWVPFNYKTVTRRRRKKIATPKKSLYFAYNTRKKRKLIQSFQVLNTSNAWQGVVFKTLFAIFDGYKTYRNIEPYFVIRKFLRILCSHRRHFVEYVKYYNSLVDKKFFNGRFFAKNIRSVTRFNFSFFKVHHYFFCCTSYLKLVRFFNRFFFNKNFFLLRFVFKHFITKRFFAQKKHFFYNNNDFVVYKLNRYNMRKLAVPLLIDNLVIYNYNNVSRTFFSLGFNNIFYYFYSDISFKCSKSDFLSSDVILPPNTVFKLTKKFFNFPIKLVKRSNFLTKYLYILLLKQRWFYMPSLLRNFNKSFFYYLFKEFRFINFLISFLFFNFYFDSGSINVYYILYLRNIISYKFFLSVYSSLYKNSLFNVSHISIFLRRSLFSQQVLLLSEYSISTFNKVLRDIYSLNSSIFFINFSSVVFDDYFLRKKYLALYYRMLNIRQEFFRYVLRYKRGFKGKLYNNSKLLTNFFLKQKRRIKYRNYPHRPRSKILTVYYKTMFIRLLKGFLNDRYLFSFDLASFKELCVNKFRNFNSFSKYSLFRKHSFIGKSKKRFLFSYFKFNLKNKKRLLLINKNALLFRFSVLNLYSLQKYFSRFFIKSPQVLRKKTRSSFVYYFVNFYRAVFRFMTFYKKTMFFNFNIFNIFKFFKYKRFLFCFIKYFRYFKLYLFFFRKFYFKHKSGFFVSFIKVYNFLVRFISLSSSKLFFLFNRFLFIIHSKYKKNVYAYKKIFIKKFFGFKYVFFNFYKKSYLNHSDIKCYYRSKYFLQNLNL